MFSNRLIPSWVVWWRWLALTQFDENKNQYQFNQNALSQSERAQPWPTSVYNIFGYLHVKNILYTIYGSKCKKKKKKINLWPDAWIEENRMGVCVCSACVSFDCRYYPSKWYEMTASSAFLRTIFFLVVPSVNTANVAHSQPSTESDSFDVCQSRFGGRVSFVRSTLITPNASRRIKRQIQNRENGIKI